VRTAAAYFAGLLSQLNASKVRRFSVNKFVPAIAALMLCSFSFAETLNPAGAAKKPRAQENVTQAAALRSFSSADCAFTFTHGINDNAFLKFCVTANGNVTVFESPLNVEHIAIGKDGEGYGVCDLNSGIAYDDFAEFGDSGNWASPTVVSKTSKGVTIARSTSDGVWTLTQTFTQVLGKSPFVKIGMTLKNNTTVARTARLVRYADADVGGLNLNNFDATLRSAMAWNASGAAQPFGLALEDLNLSEQQTGFVQGVPDPPAPCDAFAHQAQGPLTRIDGSIVMLYDFGVFGGLSHTVTLRYRRF
jgi:hypothetical protein